MERDAVGVDAEVVVERGDEVLDADSAFGGVFASDVGGADDLAGGDAAAAEDERHRAGPVIAAGLHRTGRAAGDAAAGTRRVVDLRSAAEVAADDDQRAAVEAPFVNLFDQHGDGLVHERRAVLQRVEDVLVDGVIVPVVGSATEFTCQRDTD